MGVIGVSLWLLLMIVLLSGVIRIIKKSSSKDRSLVMSVSFPFVGTLFLFSTNPYLFSSFGIIFIVFSFFVVSYLHQKDVENKDQRF